MEDWGNGNEDVTHRENPGATAEHLSELLYMEYRHGDGCAFQTNGQRRPDYDLRASFL